MLASLPRFWARNGWTNWHLYGAIAMVTVGVLATLEAWKDIFLIARGEEEASHIFLVPIVFLWLIWVRRGRFRNCFPTGQAIGPVLVLFGWLLSRYGYHHGYQAFWHGGAVILVIGCLLSVMGKDILLKFIPAFAVLMFFVPIPGSIRQAIALPLQAKLAVVTHDLFDVLDMGMSITRKGNLLTVNGVDVAIAEACNGMRMVFALVLVSYLYAFSTPLKGYVRGIIIVLSPLSALFCNVIRMVPTVWLYGKSESPILGFDGPTFAETFHDLAAWPMLFIAFLMLAGIIRILQWALIPVSRYTLATE